MRSLRGVYARRFAIAVEVADSDYRASGMRDDCEETDHWELTPDRYLFPGDPTPRMSMPGFTSDVNKLPLSVSTTSVGIGLT